MNFTDDPSTNQCNTKKALSSEFTAENVVKHENQRKVCSKTVCSDKNEKAKETKEEESLESSVSSSARDCVQGPSHDHDDTPYLLEKSEDELVNNEASKTSKINTNEAREKRRRKKHTTEMREKRVNRLRLMEKEELETLLLDTEDELEGCQAQNFVLNYKLVTKDIELKQERKKSERLWIEIERLRAEQTSHVKKYNHNDINIYGGNCNMQLGDSSVMQNESGKTEEHSLKLKEIKELIQDGVKEIKRELREFREENGHINKSCHLPREAN